MTETTREYGVYSPGQLRRAAAASAAGPAAG